MVDPLAEMAWDVQSFDIPRTVWIYPDKDGIRWWTKACFNNAQKREGAVPITIPEAIRFIRDEGDGKKDPFMEKHFKKQMENYHAAIEMAQRQFVESLNFRKY